MADYTEPNVHTVKIYKCQNGDVLVIEDTGVLALGTGVNVSVSGTNVILAGLPTTDPGVTGALWVDATANKTLKLSAS